MTPADLGLPARFHDWRKGQYDAVIDVATRPERFIACAMPTGAGKSLFYVAIAKLLQLRCLILTANKGLQDQLIADFGSIGMIDIRGQSNYRCRALDDTPDMGKLRALWASGSGVAATFSRPGSGCDHGPCHAGIDCDLRRSGCTYYDQTRKAIRAPFVVTNYDYWMYQNRFGDEAVGKFDMLVLDEADKAADKLAEFVSIRISRIELDELLGTDLPPVDSDIDHWADWGRKWALELESMMEHAKLKRSTTMVRRVRDLLDKMKSLSAAGKWKRGNPSSPDVWMPGIKSDWVAERDAAGMTFSPVWAHGYAEEYLFAKIGKVVMTSATLMPGTLKYLGVEL